MQYRIIRSGQSDDYFEHALFGKGRQKGVQNKNHKYLARAWIQNKWRYAYTQAEVKALENWGKVKNGGLADKKKLYEAKQNAKAAEKDLKKTEKEISNTVKGAVNVASGKVKETTDKVSNAAQKTVYNVSNSVQKTAKETKKVVSNKVNETAKKAQGAVNVASGKVKETADKVSNVAGKTVYNAKKSAQQGVKEAKKVVANTAETAAKKAQGAVNVASGKVKETTDKVSNAAEKAAYNVKQTANSVVQDIKSGTAAKQASIKAKTAANDIKNAASKAKDDVKAASEKAAASAKESYAKGKEKVENLFQKKTDGKEQTASTPQQSTVTSKSGRKYEGTGQKAEARKEEGGVAGGPVSGNTNMQGRGEEQKKSSLKDKASEAMETGKNKVADLAKKANIAKEALKTGAYLTKSNVKNYMADENNDHNNKVLADTAGKSTLKGQKVTSSFSEGNGLLSKSTLTKKQNEDGTVEYEHHTEYGKIAQTAKKGKELADKLFDNNGLTNKPGMPKNFEAKKSNASSSDKSLSETMEKGKAKASEFLNKAKETASKVADKVTDTAEKVADKVSDAKATAEHKAYANKMKQKYGENSLHYADAQAYVAHDKTVDALQKARDKYGVDSPEYKAAAANEQRARDEMDEVHEQNLYTNNKEYKKVSDQASALGRYIDNMDARGGPKTAEAGANYRKAVQDLKQLEAQLERMWNEDWE